MKHLFAMRRSFAMKHLFVMKYLPAMKHLFALMQLLVALAVSLTATTSWAQDDYPSRPLRFVVPFPAGSATDATTRVLAQTMSRSLKQPIVVDNRPGADGSIAALEVMKAAPDGYTLLVATATAMSAVPVIRKNPPYDPIRDFAPISGLGNFTFFLVSNSALPVRTMTELIAHAKAHPGKLTYGSGNSTGIVAMEQLKSVTDTRMTHVAYKGEPPAILDLVSGSIDLMFATPATSMAFIRDGRLKPLATTNRSRSPLLPDVPTLGEVGLERLTFATWGGMFGPAGLPDEIARRLSREVADAFSQPDVRESARKNGLEVITSTPEGLARLVKEQLGVWRKVVEDGGIPVN